MLLRGSSAGSMRSIPQLLLDDGAVEPARAAERARCREIAVVGPSPHGGDRDARLLGDLANVNLPEF